MRPPNWASYRRWLTRLVCRAALLLLSALLLTPKSHACGGFFSAKATEGERRPSLAYEQALIVFDSEQKREHFVREVVFRTAHRAFGFVVPTPARPEVAAVKESPFASLRREFPFERPVPKGGRGLGSTGSGAGAGAGMQVLEVTTVGSFTAFVLAAQDDQALATWLTKNGFASTRQTDAWLAHYVKLGFYYVAMRYEPPKVAAAAGAASAARTKSAPARTKSETIRISFDTPVPYYPYLEPAPAGKSPAEDARLLELWLVSREAFVPVAAREQKDRVSWIRPVASGARYDGDNREQLRRALGSEAKLLPAPVAGEGGDGLRVQRFMDQKRSRLGFGDILFVPSMRHARDAQTRARLAALLPILDSRLLEAK